MKNIINKILFILTISIVTISCDDRELAILNDDANAVLSVSESVLVLDDDFPDQTALTTTWTQPDFGFDAVPTYKLLIDFAGGDFSSPITFAVGSSLEKSLITQELNSKLITFGAEADTATEFDFKVLTSLSDVSNTFSNIQTISITPYSSILDLSTTWGVVGSAANNWGATPDLPFYQTGNDNIYVAYVTLTNGEIKFRENNDWTLNYGDDGNDGTLEQNGGNIPVTAGNYKIVLNLNDLTYTIEAFSWGIVGSATTNGWGGPDMDLTYNPFHDDWRAIVSFSDGEIKFRQNNQWTTNYGDNNSDGVLDQTDPNNIAITAGNYLVIVDFNTLEYSIESIDIWGVVGSAAPNGWGGPDARFTLDYSQSDIWVLNGITLIDGEIKFRTNDDWTLNYGDNDLDGVLDQVDPNNIPVNAGTYDITLDFSDAANPTYTITP
jgi:hypothetical protein